MNQGIVNLNILFLNKNKIQIYSYSYNFRVNNIKIFCHLRSNEEISNNAMVKNKVPRKTVGLLPEKGG